MTKNDIMEKLDELGIDYNPKDLKAVLEDLYEAATAGGDPTEPAAAPVEKKPEPEKTVNFKCTKVRPKYDFKVGEVYNMPEKQAKRHVDLGHGEIVK